MTPKIERVCSGRPHPRGCQSGGAHRRFLAMRGGILEQGRDLWTLGTLFGAYRRRILLTFSLVLLESLFELLYPFATGVAINGLLERDYSSLTLLGSVWLAHLISGAFRKVYDTHTFTRIYGDVASAVVLAQGARGVPTSQ